MFVFFLAGDPCISKDFSRLVSHGYIRELKNAET